MWLVSESGQRHVFEVDPEGLVRNVPFGRYNGSLAAIGVFGVKKPVLIDEKTKALFFSQDIEIPGDPTPPPPALSGTIPIRKEYTTSAWLRLVSIYGQFRDEVPLGEKGAFSFSHVPNGQYLLMVLDRGSMQDIFRLVVDSNEFLTGRGAVHLTERDQLH
jgi:hypothetical protein